MNGSPNAAQKRFHNELREMYYDTKMKSSGVSELHHIFGSKQKWKLLTEAGVERAGEWFVILIPRTVHLDIKNYSFDAERGMFLEQQRDYERYFGRPSPVPEEVIKYYKLMKNKQTGVKNWHVS